ncbi:MAG: hypothetical protein J5783_06310 [Lachnospiraceae bacterium]|nr:hypothetical protein [Lachnospiraceae bacterium]
MRYRVKGSFTIEAAFIIPIIIFGIVGLIWAVFYLYNSVKVTADADMAVFMAEKEYASDRMPDSHVENDIEREINGYFGAGVESAYVERDGRSITARIEVGLDLPEEGILGSIVSGLRSIEHVSEADIPNKTGITRIVKAASELIKDILPDKKDDGGKGK